MFATAWNDTHTFCVRVDTESWLFENVTWLASGALTFIVVCWLLYHATNALQEGMKQRHYVGSPLGSATRAGDSSMLLHPGRCLRGTYTGELRDARAGAHMLRLRVTRVWRQFGKVWGTGDHGKCSFTWSGYFNDHRLAIRTVDSVGDGPSMDLYGNIGAMAISGEWFIHDPHVHDHGKWTAVFPLPKATVTATQDRDEPAAASVDPDAPVFAVPDTPISAAAAAAVPEEPPVEERKELQQRV